MEFELDDSEEIITDEDAQVRVWQQLCILNLTLATMPKSTGDVENVQDDNNDVSGAYNARDYAGLKVSNEVRELFEYIGRYRLQRIELHTPLRPFVPEYMPNVGEVDAYLKMPNPDGSKETLGIEVLDELSINMADKAVLEMRYIQLKKTTKAVAMKVHSIEGSSNPKLIENWIKNVGDLNTSRLPASINYSKPMPDFDKLMEEWPPVIEQTLRDNKFPGPELDVSAADYVRLIAWMLDVPVHQTKTNKGLVEAMHVIFTLFSDFKQNQHFINKQAGAPTDDNSY